MNKYKILVPTDFSEYALNALNYAIGLANEIQADIIILHTYILNDSTFLGKRVVEQLNHQRSEYGKKNLDDLLDYIKQKAPNITAKAALKTGPAVKIINSLMELEDIDFVVMGTLGATGIRAALVGSYTCNVISHANRPVLSIPPSVVFNGIQNIICATEFHISEVKALLSVLKLSKSFNSKVTLYNVDEDYEEQSEKKLLFENEINGITNGNRLDIVTEQSDDIVESIEQLIRRIKPDLLVTLGRQRGFLERFFHKSITRELTLNNVAPLLVFPSLDEDDDDSKREVDKTFLFKEILGQ